MARIVKDPAKYGLDFSEIPNEPYFQRVETGGQIDMSVAAQLAGLSTPELYELNPAFHRFATPPNGPHFLLLPVESADTFRENLLQLTPDQRMRVERYDVRPKDTLASIAKQFGTTVSMLRELNGLESNARLDPDTELRIPSSVTSLPPKVLMAAARVDGGRETLRKGQARHLHVVARGDSLSAISRKTGVPVATLASLNGMSANGTLQPGQKLKLPADAMAEKPVRQQEEARGKRVSYLVKAGDTLYSISRALQVTVEALRDWNKLGANDAIHPGQKLVAFPRGGG
jgi:membrane-bound lytic murein transglycosylase D